MAFFLLVGDAISIEENRDFSERGKIFAFDLKKKERKEVTVKDIHLYGPLKA